jgi:phosphohistidine phosphatase
MRTLYLLRHAKSSWDDESLRDFDRPLNDRGKKAAEKIGRFVAKEKLKPELILNSPALRARQTTEIVLRTSALSVEVRFDERIYEASLSTLLAVLADIPRERKSVLLVGHNPGMEELLHFLTGEAKSMPTAALAKINFEASNGEGLKRNEARLEWLVTPKGLKQK